MAGASVRHIPCGEPVNASERMAVEKVKSKLQGLTGSWIVLSNLSHSYNVDRLSDEIDIVILGQAGIAVVEVKHWDPGFLKQRPEVVDVEAEKINEKAKRVAGKLRTELDAGFVSASLLLTRGGTGQHGGNRLHVRGVPVFGLSECKELAESARGAVLTAAQLERAAHMLAPATRVSIGKQLRHFGGLVNLERQPPLEDPFHRIYRGQHPSRRDKVVLHLYDLSAADDKEAEARARREFDVIQRWQKSPFLPNLLDSFQEAESYPGELFYFSLVDPAAPPVADRRLDDAWSLEERLRFARAALQALAELHHPSEDSLPPIVHRHVTPQTLRVRHNGQPLFTDFSLARLAEAMTISAHATPPEGDSEFFAPEVIRGGLAAADSRSDTYALCKTLATIFSGGDTKAREAFDFLQGGCAENPEDRDALADLAAVLERATGSTAQRQPSLPKAEFWDEETVVPFQSARYKIVGRLGRGGIGQTFKVVEVDAKSDELYGTYVAKLIHHEADATAALRAYRKARAYTTHRNLSAIHEIAPEWKPDRFVALLKWIEGTPLSDLTGILALHAEDLAEASLQTLVLRWLGDLCNALWELHRVSLVHGDVSPRNLIVHAGNIVLTDYDTVADVGSTPRSRNLLYASQAVATGQTIQPNDDIFSLAATFFHVLFEREPFLFGTDRVKTVGCNWDQLNTTGLERVAEFIAKATSANPQERFEDARAAAAFLDSTPNSTSGQLGTVNFAPTLTPQSVQRLAELLSAYPGSRHGNNETRGLDSEFAAATYVETRLDAALRDEIETGEVALAILFGNAGDGKTAFLQHLLLELGLPDAHSSHRILERRLPDGRILHVNLDGSAAWQGKAANELLDKFFSPFKALDLHRDWRNPRILAINSGKLLEWLETQDETPLTRQLYGALFEGDSTSEANLDRHIRLIDLNRRSLVGGVESGEIKATFLNALLDRFLGSHEPVDPWGNCSRCTAQHRCSAWQSVQSLRDPVLGSRIRTRLADALQACHLRGEIHITARELRAAVVFTFFGVHDCSELHANPEIAPLHYWDRAFDADAPQRQGELLSELARFDPALDNNSLVDRVLLRGLSNPVASPRDALASARRRAWFEWGAEAFDQIHLPADTLTLQGGSRLDLFRTIPLLGDADRNLICRDLCLGIARLEDLPQEAFAGERGLPLRIQPRTPTETAFWVAKPWSSFQLSAPLARTAEGLEVLHTHLVLTYTYADESEERLPIGLELFHLLLSLKEGAQLSGAGQEGVFAHLEIFTQRLAQEDTRVLFSWHPSEEGKTFQVAVQRIEERQVLTRKETA